MQFKRIFRKFPILLGLVIELTRHTRGDEIMIKKSNPSILNNENPISTTFRFYYYPRNKRGSYLIYDNGEQFQLLYSTAGVVIECSNMFSL
jgi:hypothetical protein